MLQYNIYTAALGPAKAERPGRRAHRADGVAAGAVGPEGVGASHLGFGRIVASEIAAPNILVNLV